METDRHTDTQTDWSDRLLNCLLSQLKKKEDLDSFKRAFEIFDRDGSGKINMDELDNLLLELTSKDPSDEEVKQVCMAKMYMFV